MNKRQLVTAFKQYFEIRNGEIFTPVKIYFKKLNSGYAGFCFPERDSIIIEINKNMDDANTISTLFHELVHAKQFDSGILHWKKSGKFYWKGKRNKQPYSKQPWERQAYKIQDSMVEELI